MLYILLFMEFGLINKYINGIKHMCILVINVLRYTKLILHK